MEKTNYFQLNKNNIGYLGDNFKSWFGGMKSTPKKVKLYSFILPKSMNDEVILKEYKPMACTLNDIAWYMKNDKALKNQWNVFYVKGKEDILRAVSVLWSASYHDWFVDALEVSDPYEWVAGDRFFSRTPLLNYSDTLNVEAKAETLEARVKDLEAWRERMTKWMNG